jgi:hypothetical protein
MTGIAAGERCGTQYRGRPTERHSELSDLGDQLASVVSKSRPAIEEEGLREMVAFRNQPESSGGAKLVYFELAPPPFNTYAVY